METLETKGKLFELSGFKRKTFVIMFSRAPARDIAALCELFDKTDTGGDGTISMKEYVAMCDEYGIELTDEHYNLVKSIANENGEVVFCPH